ncbi:hypothetical protein [Marinoscillum sp.]|uniref:hypothetical protein n=1 Tax=Marinoscillum sp. TaxID=2024838 RepID=UPI003873ACC7
MFQDDRAAVQDNHVAFEDNRVGFQDSRATVEYDRLPQYYHWISQQLVILDFNSIESNTANGNQKI